MRSGGGVSAARYIRSRSTDVMIGRKLAAGSMPKFTSPILLYLEDRRWSSQMTNEAICYIGIVLRFAEEQGFPRMWSYYRKTRSSLQTSIKATRPFAAVVNAQSGREEQLAELPNNRGAVGATT